MNQIANSSNPAKKHKPAAGRRRAVLEQLKLDGPMNAEALAGLLGVSAMAVRQHLYSLAEEGLVDYEEEARPVGRPAKLWQLTPAADSYFPNGHQDLSVGLLGNLRQIFGEAGMDKLLRLRAEEQTDLYRSEIAPNASLRGQLESLAEIRSREGYMAAVEEAGDGEFLLIENHCPVCAAASVCQGLCALELEVFRAVLGEDVAVERTDHILAGARRCAYRVRKAGTPAKK